MGSNDPLAFNPRSTLPPVNDRGLNEEAWRIVAVGTTGALG
jgi:hypothetical protein